MLAYVEDPANGIVEIKIWSLPRLARNLELQVKTFARLKRAKVKLLSLTQSFSDDPSGNLMGNMLAIFDEHFALESAKHTKRTMRGNAQEDFYNGGPVPFGYESRTVEMRGNKAKKKLFVVESEATVVRTMFRLATVGDGGGPLGARGIGEWLGDRGYLIRNRQFNNSNVSGILGREHYLGRYFDKIVIDDGKPGSEAAWVTVKCPAIIDQVTFDSAAALRATRAPRVTAPRLVNGPTLLTNVGRCGICGSGMTITTGKGGRYSYYKCNKKVNGAAKRCPSKGIREEQLDGVVMSALEQRLFQPERLRELLAQMLEVSAEADEQRSRDLAHARTSRTQAETRLRNLYEIQADGQASVRDRIFADLLAEGKARLASLTATVDLLESQAHRGNRKITAELVDRFALIIRERLRDAEPALRKGYVRLFVSRVTIDATELKITGSNEALALAVSRMPAASHVVPSFDREWCPEEASNPMHMVVHGCASGP